MLSKKAWLLSRVEKTRALSLANVFRSYDGMLSFQCFVNIICTPKKIAKSSCFTKSQVLNTFPFYRRNDVNLILVEN